jgi:NAD(P)-dependent dehydrogenase (short-subunit alcohol dehydrogenase family)
MPVALITGASRGFGRALSAALGERGWDLVVDARGREDLGAATAAIRAGGRLCCVAGDVSEPEHRAELRRRVDELGPLDLLVNNASELGPSPLPRLDSHPLDALERIYRVNVIAPLALVQETLAGMSQVASVVNVSSDAAVEAYEGWGGYGSSKAALDQITAVLATEHPELRWYSFDPGDMRTAMHQAAYPGEDISDRPEPETVVPALLTLVEERPPSGRYRAADLLAAATA